MILDSISYLLPIYWPYLVGALVIGLGAGWFSFSPAKK